MPALARRCVWRLLKWQAYNMAAVAFDYLGWSARYPELAAYVSLQLATAYFNEAGLYCDNTVNSPVTDDSVGGQRYMFLNMLTAHIAALNALLGGSHLLRWWAASAMLPRAA